MRTILLLLASNVFMTAAWYGHLRHRELSLWPAILVSWGIAFFEYCLQVPANRIGYAAGFSAAELKTLIVFVVFAHFYLHEPMRWNVAVGFLLIGLGAVCVFKPW